MWLQTCAFLLNALQKKSQTAAVNIKYEYEFEYLENEKSFLD